MIRRYVAALTPQAGGAQPSHSDAYAMYAALLEAMGSEAAGKMHDSADCSISQYIVSNLERVGHTKVTAQIAALELLNIPEKKIETKNVTVSSLRADTVFGAVFGKSRSEAQEAIRAERASVNGRPLKSVSEPINDGDVLSVKGWGRGTLVQTGGTTKKGRIVITVGRYV